MDGPPNVGGFRQKFDRPRGSARTPEILASSLAFCGGPSPPFRISGRTPKITERVSGVLQHLELKSQLKEN